MKPRPSSPARVFVRLEIVQHAAMARKAAAGDLEGAAAVRRSLPGWSRLRSMAARDEPRAAWMN